MIRVYIAIKELIKQQIFIADGQWRLFFFPLLFFSAAEQFSSIDAMGSPQHTETYQRHLLCFEHERGVKHDHLRIQKTYQEWDPQAAWESGRHSPQKQALGRTCLACQWGPPLLSLPWQYFLQLEWVVIQGGCISQSAKADRAGDSCAGERFTRKSYQSEGVEGPNPGKPVPSLLIPILIECQSTGGLEAEGSQPALASAAEGAQAKLALPFLWGTMPHCGWQYVHRTQDATALILVVLSPGMVGLVGFWALQGFSCWTSSCVFTQTCVSGNPVQRLNLVLGNSYCVTCEMGWSRMGWEKGRLEFLRKNRMDGAGVDVVGRLPCTSLT